MYIKSNLKEYEVVIENSYDIFSLLTKKENALFVIDSNVYQLYKEHFMNLSLDRLVIIEAVEQNKTIETALSICEKLTEIPAKRNATLISIGGGIIQDITGFVANITYRGINWIFVPTTLLSACDSCIGGKTSLNYKKYKNLLGTFFPPDEIHIIPQMFKTLSDRDLKSGLGEVVKFNIMKGSAALSEMEKNIDLLLQYDNDIVAKYLISSLEFKKSFIEIDEFDKGERIKLNFAHTFGHAIEVVTEYQIPHGTAVAIGMIMANSVSEKRRLVDKEFVIRSERLLLKVIDINISHMEVSMEKFIQAMRKDKKQTSTDLTAVLIANYGEAAELVVTKDIKEEEVKYAIDYFKTLYINSMGAWQ